MRLNGRSVMAEIAPAARYSNSLAAAVGAGTGMVVYGLVHGLAAFDLTQSAAVTDLLLHAAAGATLFTAGAAVRNRIAA